jgi:hypothetical protein
MAPVALMAAAVAAQALMEAFGLTVVGLEQYKLTSRRS